MLQNIFVHFNKSNKFEATNFVYIAGIGKISFFYLNVRLCVCFQALCVFLSGSVCVFKLCACFQSLCVFSSSVRVFKLCACFQALCVFSSSVHVFKLCACFQALCMFSGSARVFKLCACFHYLKSIFVFILHHFLYLQNRQFRLLDFSLFS